jgi:ATP-dependent Clp protease ATP-binding subunit ClpC
MDKGFNTVQGARPLRRAIEKYLEDPLAEEILRGKFSEKEPIEVTASGEQLKFRQKRAPAGKISKKEEGLQIGR